MCAKCCLSKTIQQIEAYTVAPKKNEIETSKEKKLSPPEEKVVSS